MENLQVDSRELFKYDVCFTPEQVALQSLVDTLIAQADEETHTIMQKILYYEQHRVA